MNVRATAASSATIPAARPEVSPFAIATASVTPSTPCTVTVATLSASFAHSWPSGPSASATPIRASVSRSAGSSASAVRSTSRRLSRLQTPSRSRLASTIAAARSGSADASTYSTPPPSACASVRTPFSAASCASAAVVGPLPRRITSGTSRGSETRMRAPSRSDERTRPTAPGGSPAEASAGRRTSSTSAVTVLIAAPPVRSSAAFWLFSSWPATSTATFGRASKFAPTTPTGIRRSWTRRPFSSVQASISRSSGGSAARIRSWSPIAATRASSSRRRSSAPASSRPAASAMSAAFAASTVVARSSSRAAAAESAASTASSASAASASFAACASSSTVMRSSSIARNVEEGGMSVASDSVDPLRRDVRLLGAILGNVLVEQEGSGLLDAVERVRVLSRGARSRGETDTTVARLTATEQALVLRAFGLYFQLANLAEQHHRLRRRADYAREGRAPPESLAAAFDQLSDVPPDELGRRARATRVELVLTAHPTEATRRTRLLAHVRISAELDRLDDPLLSTAERQDVEERLAEEVTLLWQADEVRHDRPRVSDEIRHGLWFFEHTLLETAPGLLRDWRRHLPDAPPPLAFGTWIGGDLDGNPAAGPETIAEALDRSRELALARYAALVRDLAVTIASHRALVGVSEEFDESLARDERELPAYAAEIGAQNAREPYRRKLSFMWWRLTTEGYAEPEDLLRDLATIRRSLAANGGRRVADGRVAAVERAVEIFGFHLAKLDVRLHARDLGGERGRRLPRPRARRRAARRRAALRDDRRSRRRAADPRRAPPRRPDRARRRRRGDGRLLRLREGRRLPGRAVGDPSRAGGAVRDGARARRRADGLPRARWVDGPRRRPDARGDRLPAARPSTGARQGDRAGGDRVLQVRARGARAAESRGRSGRNAPRDVPGAHRADPDRRGARDARRAGARGPRPVPGVRLGGRCVRRVLPRVHAGRRARAARDRVAAGAAAGRR